jgi:glutathione peroxidase
MSLRQTILRKAYPLLMKLSASGGKAKTLFPEIGAKLLPIPSDVSLNLSNGEFWTHDNTSGKYTLLVNTASDCGFTAQYAQLQELADKYSDKLLVLGIPANDFKQQEPGSDAEIALFCSRNFGVTFPVARKTTVVKGPQQHPIYYWLSHAQANGWNNHAPDWNFSKYLLSPDGKLMAYFGPAVEPSVCAELLR